jgi:hypothetical protein
MSVYGINEVTGERVLLYIECDFCDAKIKPHQEINQSGWQKRGTYYGPGDDRNTQVDLCPEHAIR